MQAMSNMQQHIHVTQAARRLPNAPFLNKKSWIHYLPTKQVDVDVGVFGEEVVSTLHVARKKVKVKAKVKS
jgi:hypothetical protein